MTVEPDDALTIRDVSERLAKSVPGVTSRQIRESVQTAYDELRYARVRSYLPVLMERRAKDLLAAEHLHP
ncbi:three-helix bundle dimerization domain-containing protein [Streptomyces sp. NPDC059176]|uniref:three-helix bundle dimerization domain-containing protein n=1 Tax=unclassified Streptomyces TaxID=2593676 RepID=UPI0036ABC685